MNIALSLIVLFFLTVNSIRAADTDSLQDEMVVVKYEHSLQDAAREVAVLYPKLKADLEAVFGWKLGERPTVFLTRNRGSFGYLLENARIVAFAVPQENLVVIDHTKVRTLPFTLEITLKHELCHLLLHSQMGDRRLPRWLDEGVCQWVSDGIGEFILDQDRSLLSDAVRNRSYIPLEAMEGSFPSDQDGLGLAYEESKSFVLYLIGHYGKASLLNALRDIRTGERTKTAFLREFSAPLVTLERRWHDTLRSKMNLFVRISYHLYEILFAIMALITLYAFIKAFMKKRAYKDEESDDSLSP